ncbi:MAG: GyrI-like domain-containing protein [Clostridiales bacterium]|nr:GyrI-like domain-containing protein [Clostridiales bacterium]
MAFDLLEGLWSLEGEEHPSASIDKDKFKWTSMLRIPDFVTDEVFERFKEKLAAKKPELNLSVICREKFAEGFCGQITHVGSYDDEPETIAALERFIEESGYRTEITGIRRRHEIYLGDPRKVSPEKLKTIIRHPIGKVGNKR